MKKGIQEGLEKDEEKGKKARILEERRTMNDKDRKDRSMNRTTQTRTEQNRTEPNRTERNMTRQTDQNGTEQNKRGLPSCAQERSPIF